MNQEISNKMKEYFNNMFEKSSIKIDEKHLENSVVNLGNRKRIADVIRKAISGEEITISFFGGSITAGSASGSAPKEEYAVSSSFELQDNTYCHHVCRWFKEMFSCPVKMENAGIGATDTPFAVHRMGQDVLSKNPDLVIVEWCVNDGSEFLYKQGTYENMVRSFLESGTALLMLSMDTSYMSSSQPLHEPIAKHYDVPHLSYRNAFSKHPDYQKLSNDTVHPNSVGHPFTALILNYFFWNVYKDLENIVNDSGIPETTIHPDGAIYSGAFVAPLKDIYENKVEGVRIKSLGSFSFDSEERGFGFRRYFGLTARYSNEYSPLIIEIDSCKTLFLQMFRSNVNKGSLYNVSLNGEELSGPTFTCMHGTDNSQTEWCYHWASERLCYYPDRKKVVLEITPNISADFKDARVCFYALLLS